MRGPDTQQSAMFSYVSPEERIPADHPLRPIRRMVDQALAALSRRFDEMLVHIEPEGMSEADAD